MPNKQIAYYYSSKTHQSNASVSLLRTYKMKAEAYSYNTRTFAMTKWELSTIKRGKDNEYIKNVYPEIKK